MVADVDVVRRLSGPSVVSLPMGRRNCPEGRHTARLRRAVRPEIAVAIHGKRAGEHAPTPIGRRRCYALEPRIGTVVEVTFCLAIGITSIAVGQNASKLSEAKVQEADLKTMVIPAGTKVPLALKQAISTKSAKEGDPVYAETTFPFVVDNRIIIPAGTYVQGRISHVQRPGRVKGRAELLMHFTSMIYPSGYTVVLPGSVDNMPGADKTSMKDSEGTIRQDGQKAKDIGQVASTASTGAIIGGVTDGGKGAAIGAAGGSAVGLAIALLSRGSDVRLEPGTSVEMVIQREVTVDSARIEKAAK